MVAIVTGSSRGIGAAVAEQLARDSFIAFINYATSVAPAETLAANIVKAGGRATTVQANWSDPAAMARRIISSSMTAEANTRVSGIGD